MLFAHPAVHRSRVNRRLFAAARGLDGVTPHDLYEAYPDLHIDVEREQALLSRHEVIVWQHPLYWYSAPAILKEWQDLVLTFNWAYGPEGQALRDKRFLLALTTGGRSEAYTGQDPGRFSLRQLLSPVEQTARLCGMTMLPPFVVHGTHRLDDAGVQRHAADYRRLLVALRDGTLAVEALGDAQTMADVPGVMSHG